MAELEIKAVSGERQKECVAHGWLAAELCLGFTRVEPKRELGQLAENPPAYQKKRLKASQRGGRRSHRKGCVCQPRAKLSTASGRQEKGAHGDEIREDLGDLGKCEWGHQGGIWVMEIPGHVGCREEETASTGRSQQ